MHNISMIKIIYVIFIFFSTSQVFGNNEQIIPNGIYEFIWRVQYTEEGTSDLLANDYVEIIDDKINFLHMPCSKGLDANLRYGFDYKFNKDLSKLEVIGKDVSIWNDRYLKNKSNDNFMTDVSFKFDIESIKNKDPYFFEIESYSPHVYENKLFLTITRSSNAPESNFKCLYERIDYESATPKSANDLKDGLSSMSRTKVFGRLFLPQKINQKVPLVITVHPSMGFTPTDYLEWFSDLGVAVFDTQPYLSRGVESQWFYKISEEAATIDTYKALDVLSQDPRIDKDKIIILGWSYGGIVVNNAHQKFFIDKIQPENKFQAFISYYPFCPLVKNDIETSDKPLTIFIGKDDRMCPYELCLDYINIVKKSSPESKIHIFEDSYHRFDFNLLPKALNIGRAEKWDGEYVQKLIKDGKRYDIGEKHEDIMGPNGWSYISLLSEEEINQLLDPYRVEDNFIGYNKKADDEARNVISQIINNL